MELERNLVLFVRIHCAFSFSTCDGQVTDQSEHLSYVTGGGGDDAGLL